MEERIFSKLINARWRENKFVCVGLDSDQNKIPQAAVRDSDEETLVCFGSAIVDATRDLVCAYKPNWAFYLALGLPGISALIRTVSYIKQWAPGVPVIGDMKVADIDNTNNGYVKAAFDVFGFDAITVQPYLGGEALQPFLSRPDKGFFVLCRTSNKGAGEFQNSWVYLRDLSKEAREFFADLWKRKEVAIEMAHARIPLYRYVAYRVAKEWNQNGNCCLVTGATYPEEMKDVRQTVGNLPLLIPGLGSQGGEIELAVKYGMDSENEGAIYNSSRAIIFGSSGPDFAKIARQETIKLHAAINQYRGKTGSIRK